MRSETFQKSDRLRPTPANMSSNPIDRCKANFEVATEAFRNAVFREPVPEVGGGEARTELQSMSEEGLMRRYAKHSSIVHCVAWEILNVDLDLTEANNERQVLDSIRQFEESADIVVSVIYELIRRQSREMVNKMRDQVQESLDELDRWRLDQLDRLPPPPLPAITYELMREVLRNAAFREPAPEVSWCETLAEVQSMSEDTLVDTFDIWVRGMYNDAYHSILGPYTAANSKEVLEGISQFTESGDIVVFLIHEALAREQKVATFRELPYFQHLEQKVGPERFNEGKVSVSDWRRQLEDVLDKTRSCGRPCFHRGVELEDGRLSFPCDKEHQTPDESHESRNNR
jgi:hypothetical protein